MGKRFWVLGWGANGFSGRFMGELIFFTIVNSDFYTNCSKTGPTPQVVINERYNIKYR